MQVSVVKRLWLFELSNVLNLTSRDQLFKGCVTLKVEAPYSNSPSCQV